MEFRVVARENLPHEPASHPTRHASTLLPLPDGSILAAWFAGKYEAEADVDIWLTRRSADGGWSQPTRVSEELGIAHWNPVLARRSNGDIVLYYKVGFEIGRWKTMLRVSCDGGSTWDAPREAVSGDEGGRGPVRNKILVTSGGRWIAGASLERGPRWTAFADLSDDEGQSWRRGSEIALADEASGAEINPSGGRPNIAVTEQSFKGRGLIQPTLWEDAEGIHMLLRSTEGWAFRSDSKDGGELWTPPRPTSVPNNNSGLDLLGMDDGTLVLAHNPVGGNWGERTPLVLSLSTDGGETWERTLVLDEGPGEFSYPAIQRAGADLCVTWTRNRKEIAFARVQTRRTVPDTTRSTR